jgi:hypothetical protein
VGDSAIRDVPLWLMNQLVECREDVTLLRHDRGVLQEYSNQRIPALDLPGLLSALMRCADAGDV